MNRNTIFLDVGTMFSFMIMNDLPVLLLKTRLEGYRFPVYTTKSCPRNNTQWLERSSTFNCNATNGYMCIPNGGMTMLLEFCYHKPIIIIPKGKKRETIKRVIIIKIQILKVRNKNHCSYTNRQNLFLNRHLMLKKCVYIAGSCLILYEHSSAVDDFKCQSFSFGCPKYPYFSNEMYKRKHCFYRNLIIY